MMARLLSVLSCAVCLGFQAQWQTYRSIEGGFSVLLPAKPTSNQRTLNTNQGAVPRKALSVQVGSDAYSVIWTDYDAKDKRVNAQAALQAARDGLVANAKGKLLDGCKVQCPFHRARFDIRTGEVIDWANFPPGIQVLNIVRGEQALKTYKVSVRDGEVRVSV